MKLRVHHRLNKPAARTASGATMVLLVFMLAFCLVGVISLFGFEVTRNNSCRDELRSACEAAALSAAAAMASSSETSVDKTHDAAERAAVETFVRNSITGTLLSDVYLSDSKNSSAATARKASPPAGWSNFYIEFLKPDGTQSAWNAPDGRIVHIIAVFGEQPIFGKYIGIDKVNVVTESKAQVPQMDIIMCFDVSGSIDDQSKVTCVKRYWSGGQIKYDIATTTAGTTAEGSIYGIFLPVPAGISVNVEQPQNLSASATGTNQRKLTFDGTLRKGPGGNDKGEPPGNYSGGAAGGSDTFTDCVANVDGNDHFGTFTYTDPSTGQVFSFPNIATLVEASRGNLENNVVFASSKANTALGGIVAPKAGYYNAYWALAHKAAQPIGSARDAAEEFFTIMNNNTDGQFGFIAFSSPPVATTPGNLWPNAVDRVSGGYGAAGTFNPPYPGQSLSPGTCNTIISNVIPKTLANGGTDIGDALQEAVNEMKANGRKGANQAIVMFTDGQPNTGPAWTAAANQANADGVAVYTIGLAQNAAIIPFECDNLNDQGGKAISYTDPLTGSSSAYTPGADGIAGVAGHGGKFFLVTNRNDLGFVFENIARQLVQLTIK